MEFRLLGPLEVRDDRGTVALRGVKPRAVLAVLLLHANQPVSAERLAAALWGDDVQPDAVRTVRVYVSRLRAALGDPDVVVTTPAGYRLDVGFEQFDLGRFEHEVGAARGALAAAEPERASKLLRAALALWRGSPLAEFACAPFAVAEIGRLEELRMAVVELRMEAELAAGRDAELVAELQRLTSEHPWRERLHAQLMLALYRGGRQADALSAYGRARGLLVDQLGLEPGTELRELHQAMLEHDAALDAPVARLSAVRAAEHQVPTGHRAAVPSPPNRTIGRERDVAAVVDRLRAGSVRLLTLTGPGGVGKTRLAAEVARAVEGDFADGAHFVSLAPLARETEVVEAIVSAVGIVPLIGESAEQAVERFLAAKHLLLVLDNCEHLPAAAPYIGRLPAVGRTVTVLATSREALGVQAEQRYPVMPLPLPDRHATHDAKRVAAVGSVALFCERARAYDPGFELVDANADAVAEICRRVDGLPLGIELAAARCGLLAPGEIAERLATAYDALGTGPRDAPGRQHTLRATLDWSHGLLTAGERVAFARLAVFAGGATVEAAQAITGARLDTLERLVAKSLLVRRLEHGSTRVGMLETVRAYAAERLSAEPDTELIHERHYRYFLAHARRHGADLALFGPMRNEHFKRLDAERENIRAAFDWTLEQDDGRAALELAAAMHEYLWHRGHAAEAVRWCEHGLRKAGVVGDPALRVRLLSRIIWPLIALGRQAEAASHLVAAEATARTVDDPAVRAEALWSRAGFEYAQRRFELAAPLADEALALATASGDRWAMAMSAWARVAAAPGAEDFVARVDGAVAALEAIGDAWHIIDVLHMAAMWAVRDGRDHDAIPYIEQAIPLVRGFDEPVLCGLRGQLGCAALCTGDADAARAAFRYELLLSHDLCAVTFVPEALTGLAALAAAEDDLDRAATLTGAADAHRRHGACDAESVARLRDTFLEPARARLGADAWETARHAGAGMSLDDAVAYALAAPATELPAAQRA